MEEEEISWAQEVLYLDLPWRKFIFVATKLNISMMDLTTLCGGEIR